MTRMDGQLEDGRLQRSGAGLRRRRGQQYRRWQVPPTGVNMVDDDPGYAQLVQSDRQRSG